MATETIFLQNKEFGEIADVMLLKGFWFNNVDPNFQGLFTYMMNPWRDHLAKPFIQIIGYALFSIVFLGFVKAILSKKPILTAFSFLFLFAFTMLTTATPPFSWFDQIFRIIPLFNQAFRFPFTKFSILTALTYSIFFSIGLYTIKEFVNKKIKFSIMPYLISLIAFVSLIIFVFPAFRLDLFITRKGLKFRRNISKHMNSSRLRIRILVLPTSLSTQSGDGISTAGVTEDPAFHGMVSNNQFWIVRLMYGRLIMRIITGKQQTRCTVRMQNSLKMY